MCILMIIGRMILNKYSQKTWVVFVQGSFSRGGLCPGGFSPDGFCPGGFFVRGGFCPYTEQCTRTLLMKMYSAPGLCNTYDIKLCVHAEKAF